MKKMILLAAMALASIANADVTALKCSVTGDLIQNSKSFFLPVDSDVRKVTYMISEDTPNKMATYNTTVNLRLKVTAQGLQMVSFEAWPQGGGNAQVQNNDVVVSVASRVAKTRLSSRLSCVETSSPYYVVSKYTFKDEPYLNVAGAVATSFAKLEQMSNDIAYVIGMTRAGSTSELAAREFCFMGNSSLVFQDLSESVSLQLAAEAQKLNVPNYWQKSGYSQKTLAPLGLSQDRDGDISWQQPVESSVCTKSHNEVQPDPDSGMDQNLTICDEYAPKTEAAKVLVFKKCEQ